MNQHDADVRKFFKNLGLFVTCDHRGSEHWHELYGPNGLLLQIPFGVPLSDLLEDLPLLADGKTGTSATDYEIRGPLFATQFIVKLIQEHQEEEQCLTASS